MGIETRFWERFTSGRLVRKGHAEHLPCFMTGLWVRTSETLGLERLACGKGADDDELEEDGVGIETRFHSIEDELVRRVRLMGLNPVPFARHQLPRRTSRPSSRG